MRHEGVGSFRILHLDCRQRTLEEATRPNPLPSGCVRFTGPCLYRLTGKSGRRSGVYACLNACDVLSVKQNPTRVPPCRFRVHPITQQKLRRPVVQPLIECPSRSSLMGRAAESSHRLCKAARDDTRGASTAACGLLSACHALLRLTGCAGQ